MITTINENGITTICVNERPVCNIQNTGVFVTVEDIKSIIDNTLYAIKQ